MKYALGVDVGGTNIRIAIVDNEGNLIKVIKEKTRLGGVEPLVSQIVDLYYKIIDDCSYKIEGMGIGVPGPVTDTGIVSHIPNLNIGEAFDLRIKIEEKINLPVYVGNDANVAGLAEAIVGNGKGYEVVQYITMSTGIGGGLIINKKMITGRYGFAQEIGAMVVRVNGRKTPYKPDGCIEGEASGTALTAKARERGLEVAHAGEVFELASKGNAIALEIKQDFLNCLSAFISSMVSYMEPDIFVLGGGLLKSADYFLNELKEAVDEVIFPSLKGKVRIVEAKYDQDCGIIGAAMQLFVK